MRILSNNQLWGRIRDLQGRTLYTPDLRRPNKIRNVSEDSVEIENRRSYPTRDDLLLCYSLVLKHGILTERNLPTHFFNHRIARICFTIIAAAIPEQIRSFPRGEGPPSAQGLSGIEVYNANKHEGMIILFDAMAYAAAGMFLLNISTLTCNTKYTLYVSGWVFIGLTILLIIISIFNRLSYWVYLIRAVFSFALFVVIGSQFVIESINSEQTFYIIPAVIILIFLLIAVFVNVGKIFCSHDTQKRGRSH